MVFCLENKLNWLYIDVNSYFATIEQQLDPALRNKPIAIVPMLTDSTCAIAASYEAKLAGIRTGTKIYQAKKLCPELICIQARTEIYVEYHKKIFNELDKYLHVDHIFSIDEGACLLTGKYCKPEHAASIAKMIKTGIRKNVGDYINCSIGIASNRYLAKIASNMQKRDGLVIINPHDLPDKLYSLELGALPGIGSKTKEKILKHGISTVRHLCTLDRQKLESAWGSIWGKKVWYLLRGANLPIEEVQNKTIGHSQVLAPDLRDVENARTVLITLILKVGSRLRSQNLYTNSILLSMELVSKNIIKERIKLPLSCDSNNLIKLIAQTWDHLININKIKQVTKISISAHNLQAQSNQLDFTGLKIRQKTEKLSRVIDSLNKKIGSNTVSIGVPLKRNKVKSSIAFSHIPDEA
ncbi:MAG: DNA-directed DNA polymerase [Rickettsiaceae bacterium]